MSLADDIRSLREEYRQRRAYFEQDGILEDYERQQLDELAAELNELEHAFSNQQTTQNTTPRVTPPVSTPVSTTPVSTTPVTQSVTNPVSSEPVCEEPLSTNPISTEPICEEPVSTPVSSEPVCEQPVAQEQIRSFTYNGTTYGFTESEFEEFKNSIIAEIRSSQLTQIRIKSESARSLWDHFRELNDDQYIVSWFVEAFRRVELPAESRIQFAERQVQNVESALVSRNLDQIETALRNAETNVNAVLDQMRHYRDSMIDGASNWVTGLQITSTACFAILAVAGGAVLAAPAAAGGAGLATGTANIIMGGSTALLSSVSNEVGEGIAGTQDENWGRDIFVDTVIGAIAGGIGGEIASRIAGRAAPALVLRVTGSTDQALITAVKNVMEGSLSSAFGGAITDTANMMTGNQTWDGFIQNLITNLIAGGFAGQMVNILPVSQRDLWARLAEATR